MPEIRFRPVLTFSLLAVVTIASAQAQTGNLDPPLNLDVDSRYVATTGTSTFTLVGPPNARFRLEAADIPAEIVNSWGTHFLDPTDSVVLKRGLLSELGEATVEISHPVESVDGTLRYFQARGIDGENLGLSKSIAVRFGDAPVGRRKPEAIAVTADGSKAYVAHALDGTISVIDATTDTLLLDMPVTAQPPFASSQQLDMAIDPEGRHLFLVNPLLPEIAVIDVASNSIAGQIPVPTSSRSVTFRFGGLSRWLHITNEGAQAVLRFEEDPAGTFVERAAIGLRGMGPGPSILLPRGRMLIAHRNSLELELIQFRGGEPFVARIPLGSPPIDIFESDGRVFVSTFTSTLPPEGDGRNEVLEIDVRERQVLGAFLADHGTDYFDAAASADHIVVLGSASGVAIVADPVTLDPLEIVELAPGEPTAVPTRAAFVADPDTGEPNKLYVVNLFRETVRPIDLSAGPPFQLLPEVALAYSGAARIPTVDLSEVEDGEWLFDSVEFFNGTATTPNPVSCATCHPRGFSDNVLHEGIQAQELFDTGTTSSWRFDGSTRTLNEFNQEAFDKHGMIGGELSHQARRLTTIYQEEGIPVPISPFLMPDGTLSPEAEAGKIVFEGEAGCIDCHEPPLFIPVRPVDRMIFEGVGTGLVPANVPSLRGKWATPPHLHNGREKSVMGMLLRNEDDRHGTTSTLTEQQLSDLVAYVLSL